MRAGSGAVTTAPLFSVINVRSLSAASTGSSAILAPPFARATISASRADGASQIGKLRQIGLRLHRQLALVHEEEVRPFRGKHGEAERQRRVRHVAAADVERPGKRGWVGQHRMRRAFLGNRCGEPRELFLGEFAGEFDRMDFDLGERRRRPVGPQLVDRIGREGNEDRAGLVRRGSQRLDVADRVQPRVETEPDALGEIGLDPFRRRIVDKALDREDFGIGLVAHLQRVAAVDEDDRAVGEHDGDAGRAGKPGQPLQPLGAGRHIFALMLVGTRHDEAVKPLRRKPFAQPRHAFAGKRRVAHFVKILEHGLAFRIETGPKLSGLRCRCNAVGLANRGSHAARDGRHALLALFVGSEHLPCGVEELQSRPKGNEMTASKNGFFRSVLEHSSRRASAKPNATSTACFCRSTTKR